MGSAEAPAKSAIEVGSGGPALLRHRKLWLWAAFGVALAVGFYAISRWNYLLFHSAAETASVIVGVMLFLAAWRLFPLTGDGFLAFLGLGFLWVAGVDFLHMLAYKGMGVFPGHDADLPTQLWIVARALQALVLVVAPVFLTRRLPAVWMFVVTGMVATIGVVAVFSGLFPTCFVEGRGLTGFKVGAEYAISLTFIGALVHLRRRGSTLDSDSLRALTVVIAVTILSELAFTLYSDVYGVANFIGHVLKLVAFGGLYALVLRNMFARPVQVLTGFVPICAGCKSIRDTEGRWRPLESYLGEATGAEFSHGLCPECLSAYDD